MSQISAAAAQAREAARHATGEFGQQQHSAPETATLGGDAETHVFELPYRQSRYGLPSPRHRKQQHYWTNETFRGEVRIVDPADAPAGVEDSDEYRVIDGRWHTKAADSVEDWFQPYRHRDEPPALDADTVDAKHRALDQLVLIDGEVWTADGAEPGYAIRTFGLGGNHGGTGLFKEGLHPFQTSDPAQAGRLFGADEHHAAVAEAVRIAEDRGDTESVRRIRATEPYTLTAAGLEACQNRTWQRPVEFPEIPYDARHDPELARETLRSVISQLEDSGIATPGEHGLPIIDWDRVTPYDRESYGTLLKAAYA